MPKITFIGAGSCVFTRNLLADTLQFPELADSEIALMDIDPERLRSGADPANAPSRPPRADRRANATSGPDPGGRDRSRFVVRS